MTFSAVTKAVAAMDRDALAKAFSKLTEHEKDLLVPCPTCKVDEMEECRDANRGVVHFGRRLKRMLMGVR